MRVSQLKPSILLTSESQRRTCSVVVKAQDSDRRKSAGPKKTVGRLHYNTKRRKRDRQQQELQDLLIDPAYDPLFDGIDDEGGSSSQDPFLAPQKKKRSGRPVGSARTKLSMEDTPQEEFVRRRKLEKAAGKDDLAYLFPEEEEESSSVFDVQLKYMRYYFLQEQQEHIMELHHKHRATEISQYAQATALAHLMEQLEREDEKSDDTDPLPSWIRAKKIIAENWSIMEELTGSRKDTIKSLQEFSTMTEERQHLLDTWDKSLYEGERDPEDDRVDHLDQYLLLSDAPKLQTERKPESREDIMNEILPDMED